METNWAAEHLQTIRTLMERTAIYRRALAPIMTFVGTVGTGGAVLGWVLKVDAPRPFILYWAAVAVVALTGSFFLVRRQALKDSEPFWSPPTRRITQALLPALAVGFVIGAVIVARAGPGADSAIVLLLPLLWVALYGCAFHAAGFFMPRGMKIFGWILILGGCGLFAISDPDQPAWYMLPNNVMGFFFGVLQLAYGLYLFFTEKRRNET